MKKSTKTTASPAPATRSSIAPKLAPKSAGAPRLVSAPATKRAASSGSRQSAGKIVVNAKIDVGFGNTLYIRGEGADLDWNKGKKLGCAGADHWTILFDEITGPIAFKFLINDETWSSGENYSAGPGTHATYTPLF